MAYRDRERQRAYARDWIRRHPDKARDAMRRWRDAHRALSRERNREYQRALYTRDPEGERARIAAYYADHPDALRAKVIAIALAVAKQRAISQLPSGRISLTSSEAFVAPAPARVPYKPIIAVRYPAAGRTSSGTSFPRAVGAISARARTPRWNSAIASHGGRFSNRLNSRIGAGEAG